MSAVLCLLTLLVAAPPGRPQGAAPTTLETLLNDADQHNPAIEAARQTWIAAQQVVPQVSTLPDPHLMIQQMPVGSPIPFSGFTTSNFAYIGFGVTQTFPFPGTGTLALRGQAASRAAEASAAQVDVERRQIHAGLTTAYAQLGAVQEVLRVLARDGALLARIEQAADARYRVGAGSQQDVLRAQLEETRLQRQIAQQQQDRDDLESEIKQFAGRPQASPDVVATSPVRTPLPADPRVLLDAVASTAPSARGRDRAVAEAQARVALAREAFKPDLAAQFMWEHTAARFPDYYMFSVNVRVPIHRHQREAPELAQATAQLAAARAASAAEVQREEARLAQALARARTADHLLTIDEQGLIPQARAALNAALAAYEAGRLDFASLLDSVRDVLSLEAEYWQTLAERQADLAAVEQITGGAQ